MTIINTTREMRVAAFNRAAGRQTFAEDTGATADMHWTIFDEEVDELAEATMTYDNNPTPENRAQLVKEWSDVQVTLSNLAWYYDIPADAAFNRVADSNMSKVSSDGTVHFRDDGKVLKPDTYVAPDMRGL